MRGQDTKPNSSSSHSNLAVNQGSKKSNKVKFTDEVVSCDSSSTATPVYSNRSSPSHTKDREKSLKGVTFSINRSKSDTNDRNDAANIYTVPELVSKPIEELAELVCSLQQKNEQLNVDYSGERALRKKKEKNLFKLAKQLNIQSIELGDQNLQIRQLISAQATLETRLEQHKMALEKVHTQTSKDARDHHIEISHSQTKHRALQTEFQDTVTKMSSENGKRIEDLRRQVLHGQLEGDRLRVQLAGLQMEAEGGSKKGIDKIIEKTLKDHDDNENENNREQTQFLGCLSSIKLWRIVGIFFGAILIPSIAVAHTMDLLSRSCVCAPAMPGTYLHSNLKGDFIFEAPWWMIPSFKKKTFDWFCARRRRTRIEWLPTTKPDGFKLVVLDLDKVGETKAGKVMNALVFERKAASITLHSNAISYENNKGNKRERRRAPWVPSRHSLRK